MASQTQSDFIGQQFKLPSRFGENVEQFFPGVLSPGSSNVDTSRPGKAIPAFDHILMSGSSDMLHYAANYIETQNPSGNPRGYWGANLTMYYLEDGVRTADNSALGDVVQGMVIGDAGGASFAVGGGAPTIAAGTKVLLVGFGNSSVTACAMRKLTTDASPWVIQTNASVFAQFWQIIKAGRDLVAVTNGGQTVLGEYHVSICPPGNDPTLITGWGGGISVGTPEWPVVKLAPIGDSFVAAKADGLWYYNDQTKRMENAMPFLQDCPNPLNGKALKSVQNGVTFDTHDGKLYFFDGVDVTEITPFKDETINRDTMQSRISAVADNGDYLALAMECWQNTTQGMGLQVVTKIAGTVADVTTSVTNGALANGAAMLNWGGAAADALYVGLNVPLESIVVRVTRQANVVAQSFGTPAYSTGTADTFTSFTSGFDGSILKTAATSLALTGFPPGASNAVIGPTDINSFDLMKATTMNFGGSVGTVTGKYWMRWQRVSASGMGSVSAGVGAVTIDELEVVPSRAGMPNTGIMSTTTNFTHRDRAGGCTHIVVMKRERSTGYVAHDTYSLHTLGGVTAMGWHTGRPGQAGNAGQILAVIGRYKQMLILDGITRDPTRTIVPKLRQYDTLGPGPLQFLGQSLLGNGLRNKYIQKVLIAGEQIQPTDTIDVYGQWDQNYDIFLLGSLKGAPAVFEGGLIFGTGRVLRLWYAFQDASQNDVTAPFITDVWCAYDYVDEDFDFARLPALALPETT